MYTNKQHPHTLKSYLDQRCTVTSNYTHHEMGRVKYSYHGLLCLDISVLLGLGWQSRQERSTSGMIVVWA